MKILIIYCSKKIGVQGDTKFNDLWKFDVSSEQWTQFEFKEGDVQPEVLKIFKKRKNIWLYFLNKNRKYSTLE